MIQRFLQAWRSTKHQPYVAHPVWADEDAELMFQFLESDTGKRFRLALLNGAIRANSSAVNTKEDRDYACGYAAGFSGAIQSIQSYAGKISEVPVSDSPDILDHLSP